MNVYDINTIENYITAPGYKVFIPKYSNHREVTSTNSEYLRAIDSADVHVYREIKNWNLEL